MTLHGSVIPTSRPVAFFEAKALIFNREWCKALDLRSMKVRESECERLNHHYRLAIS